MSIKELYKGLWDTVDGIFDKRYLKDRPLSVPVEERPDNYIVICLPYYIRNREISFDGSYNDFTTTVQLEIYVRDRCTSHNPNEFKVVDMDKFIDKVMSLFPISTDGFVVTRPRITMQAGDGDGFSLAIIQGTLRTR